LFNNFSIEVLGISVISYQLSDCSFKWTVLGENFGVFWTSGEKCSLCYIMGANLAPLQPARY